MNREIKFRAWDFTNDPNKMISWDDLCKYHSEMYWLFKPNHSQIKVMQYTGLKDKNGVEIYEGDILDLHSTVNGVRLFEIYYKESEARFRIKYFTNRMPHRDREYEYSVSDFFRNIPYEDHPEYEVMGNIHENPELLETK